MIYPKMYLKEHFNRVRKALEELDNDAVLAAAELLKEVRDGGHFVFLCGNGGSAATAGHFANDLMKMAGIKAICLNDMMPTTLAYMNDHGVRSMFADPFLALREKGDMLVVVSCSGNSENIVALVDAARVSGSSIILLTGDKGGQLAKTAGKAIKVPHPDIRVQEDVHLAVCHALAGVLSEKWD